MKHGIDASTQEFELINGNIEFINEIWKDEKAKVTLKNNTENYMEYQVINSESTINDSNWQEIHEAEYEIANLENGDIIVARLTDGNNVTSHATYNVNDLIAPHIINVTKSTEGWVNNQVIISINASDNESGLATNCYSFNGGITWQSENTKIYTENTAGIVLKVKDMAGNISTYTQTLNVNRIDKQGPEIEAETEVKSNSISIKITSLTDHNGSGIDYNLGYKYYIAQSLEELNSAEGETLSTQEKIFENLTTNTTYYIKIEVKDVLGNIGSVIKTAVPGALNIAQDALQIINLIWENKEAQVTIINKEELLNIEYQIVRKGETFDIQNEWTLVNEKNVNIPGLKNEDIVYARLTDQNDNKSGTIQRKIIDNTPPTLEVTGMPDSWTKEDVTLIINSTDTESGLHENAYSFDGGTTWQDSNSKTYSENTQGIVIQVRDEAGNITQYNDVLDITQIDKTPPKVDVEIESKNTKEITVNVNSVDSGIGMGENIIYSYYIKQKNASEFTKIIDTSSTTYKFENLKFNTQYEIKVETKDSLGNIGEKKITTTTSNIIYEVGNIEMISIIWSNSVATIELQNNRQDFTMEYQIAQNGENLNDSGTWIRSDENVKTIGALRDGYIIYARLTDMVNSSTGYVTINIVNSSKKTYTEDELARLTTRENFNILGISTSNNEIKAQIEGAQEDAYLYNYYYKNINDTNYTLISSNTYSYDPAVITNLETNAIYKIKALVTKKNGNVVRCENTATMIASRFSYKKSNI